MKEFIRNHKWLIEEKLNFYISDLKEGLVRPEESVTLIKINAEHVEYWKGLIEREIAYLENLPEGS